VIATRETTSLSRAVRRALAILGAATLFAGLTVTSPQPASAKPGPFYYVVAEHSGKPIMPLNHSTAWWTDIVQSDWQNGGALHWKVERWYVDDERLFKNRHSKLCVTAADFANPGGALPQNPCNEAGTIWVVSSPREMWAGRPFTIRAWGTWNCLDVAGASWNNGAPVGLYPCHGGHNQQFRLVHVSGT